MASLTLTHSVPPAGSTGASVVVSPAGPMGSSHLFELQVSVSSRQPHSAPSGAEVTVRERVRVPLPQVLVQEPQPDQSPFRNRDCQERTRTGPSNAASPSLFPPQAGLPAPLHFADAFAPAGGL